MWRSHTAPLYHLPTELALLWPSYQDCIVVTHVCQRISLSRSVKYRYLKILLTEAVQVTLCKARILWAPGKAEVKGYGIKNATGGLVNLLRFSQTCELWSSKAAFAIAFFAAVNHNYDHNKQRTMKHRNTQNGSKSTNHKSQTMTFWTHWSKRLFPKRTAKNIMAAKNANASWLLNFRIRVFMKKVL